MCQKRGTFTARGIASLDTGSTLISLANLGLSPVRLTKGTPVARFIQLDPDATIHQIEKMGHSRGYKKSNKHSNK